MNVFAVYYSYGQIEFIFSTRSLAEAWIAERDTDHAEWHIAEFQLDNTSDEARYGIKSE